MVVVVDMVTGSHDILAWIGNADGRFTVSSADTLLTRENSQRSDMADFFTRVWRVMVLEQVKIFLWLVVNHVIMTNMERKRRYFCEVDVCQVCKGGVESILYVFQDCPAMSGIWIRILLVRRRQTFFVQSLWDWVYDNLSDGTDTKEGNWSTMFVIVVWWVGNGEVVMFLVISGYAEAECSLLKIQLRR